MIPSTPVLWRHTLIAFLLACCSLIPLFYSVVQFAHYSRDTTLFVLILYGIFSWVFAATGFAIVFKKATSGAFGYAENYVLEFRYKSRKSFFFFFLSIAERLVGFAGLVFLCMNLMALIVGMQKNHSSVFVAVTSINAWMALLLCRLTYLQNKAVGYRRKRPFHSSGEDRSLLENGHLDEQPRRSADLVRGRQTPVPLRLRAGGR